MDYGKFKYQQSKRNHVARQNQKVVHLKEVKMKPKIEEHDFQFKLRNALRFLEDGDKVKVGVRFMGRQIAHKDLGVELLEKFQAEIGDDGTVEQPISSEGRSMHMILAPPKKESRNAMKMKTHRGAAKRFKKPEAEVTSGNELFYATVCVSATRIQNVYFAKKQWYLLQTPTL